MTYLQNPPNKSLLIDQIDNATIASYFTTINNEAFEATAALFTKNGILLAPFEEPIVGQENIIDYLTKEARGMKLIPQKVTSDVIEDNLEQITVIGKVKTSLFKVNVSWYLTLDNNQKIEKARIKLLASAQELFSINQKKEA